LVRLEGRPDRTPRRRRPRPPHHRRPPGPRRPGTPTHRPRPAPPPRRRDAAGPPPPGARDRRPPRPAPRPHPPGPLSRAAPPPPRVVWSHDATDAVVLELRATDSPGLLYRVTSALATTGARVRAARISTLGADVVDAFYLAGDFDPQAVESAVLAAAQH